MATPTSEVTASATEEQPAQPAEGPQQQPMRLEDIFPQINCTADKCRIVFEDKFDASCIKH